MIETIVPAAEQILTDYDVNSNFGAEKHSIYANAEEKRRYVNRIYDNFLLRAEHYKDINEIEKQRLLACRKIFDEVVTTANSYQFYGKNEIPAFTDLMTEIMSKFVAKEIKGSLFDVSYKEIEDAYTKYGPYIREFAKRIVELQK